MADSIVDFASVDAAAAPAAPITDSGSTAEVEVTPGAEATGTESTEGTEGTEGSEETNPDGTPKTAEQKAGAKGEATPQHIRTTLKGLRDNADPNTSEGKATIAAVKQLHGNFERYEAVRKIMPGGVAEVTKAAEFLKGLSGGQPGLQAAQESWNRTQEQLASVEATDQLLYEGDGSLITNIVEDLKSQGKLDALGKLAPSFLDALKQNDSAGYYAAFAPHLISGLRESGVPQVINNLARALASGDTAQAKSLVTGFAKWFTDLDQKNEAAKTDPLEKERKALAEERQSFESGKVKEAQTAIASSLEKSNNSILGSELKGYLKSPFFKAFSRENLVPLGNQIKSDLYATLKADKVYQTQMKALWGSKTPDRAKIAEYHTNKLKDVAALTVRNAVQRLYPGYARGGAAAGRVAEAAAKKTAETKANAQAVATGKPQYVAVKPKWEEIDWTKDPKEYSYIAGKAYLKGSGKYVTWRR